MTLAFYNDKPQSIKLDKLSGRRNPQKITKNHLKSITLFLMKQQKTPKQVKKRENKEIEQPIVKEKTSITSILQCK